MITTHRLSVVSSSSTLKRHW